MLEESAIIVAVHADTSGQSYAQLEIARKTACGLCGQTRGCGNSLWGKLFSHQSNHFTARNNIDAKVGEHVVVGIDEAAVMKSALLLYMLPLASLFIVAILVSRFTQNNALILLASALGLVFGLLWVKGYSMGNAYFRQHQPQILRLQSEQKVQFQ